LSADKFETSMSFCCSDISNQKMQLTKKGRLGHRKSSRWR